MLTFLLTLLDSSVEEEQFEVVFKKYYKLMYRIAYGILENKMDAEDAVSDVFLELACNVNKIPDFYSPSDETVKYMCTAAKYSAYDLSKKKLANGTVSIDAPEFKDRIEFLQIDDPCEETSEQLYGQVVKVIREMPVEYYRVLTLIYVKGKTYQQTANILHVPIGTVRSRHNRAIKRLRKHFDKNTVQTGGKEYGITADI